jgi:quercetin dioxygenase-like cupin family protein
MTTGHGVIHTPNADDPLRILLTERDCDGGLGVVEMAFEPGAPGPPLHVHPTHAEAFYVLAGELSLQVGDEVVTGGPGTWACAPKHVPHTLANLGTTRGRVLCVFAPGGFERCFERMVSRGADCSTAVRAVGSRTQDTSCRPTTDVADQGGHPGPGDSLNEARIPEDVG